MLPFRFNATTLFLNTFPISFFRMYGETYTVPLQLIKNPSVITHFIGLNLWYTFELFNLRTRFNAMKQKNN